MIDFMNKSGFIGVLAGSAMLAGCSSFVGVQSEYTFMKIDAVGIGVEVVSTDETRQLGLSGRDPLSDGTGMLFAYENPGLHGIWMKDMNFPIDIIWIGAEDSRKATLRVLDVEKNVDPETYPTVFTPSVPSTYALEVNAGFIDANEVGIGDGVTIDW